MQHKKFSSETTFTTSIFFHIASKLHGVTLQIISRIFFDAIRNISTISVSIILRKTFSEAEFHSSEWQNVSQNLWGGKTYDMPIFVYFAFIVLAGLLQRNFYRIQRSCSISVAFGSLPLCFEFPNSCSTVKWLVPLGRGKLNSTAWTNYFHPYTLIFATDKW